MTSSFHIAAAVALLLGSAAANADDKTVSVAAYQQAEAMLQDNVRSKMRNLAIDPVWLPDGNRFWYRHESASGWDYVAIDPDAATRSAAFDHAALATAISSVLEKPVDAAHLPLDALRFADASGQRIAFTAQGAQVRCDLAAASCTAEKMPAASAQQLASPDGKSVAFARNDNLFVRDIASGKERQVTRDGVAHFSYGKMPDAQLLRVLSDTRGFPLPLYGIEWAPDSRHLVATRVDERNVPDYPFLQLAPYNGDRRPRVTMVRSPLSGLPKPPVEVTIVDTVAATAKPVPVGSDGLSTVHFWDPSGRRFFALQGGDYTRTQALYEVALPSGTARKVASEDSKTFLQVAPLIYDAPAFRLLPASNEMIWFSQRDGWNHLYRVDLKTGAFTPITRGAWNVQNILRVDETARLVWFTGAGREAGENPYWRHLYVASLDGGDARNLTAEAADHAFPPQPNALFALLFGRAAMPSSMISPSGRYFVDTISTVTQPPAIVLKRADGSTAMQLETADISEATAAGFTLPEPFTAKAADGRTDLYGWVLKPPQFDAQSRYPVIDAIYNGPQIVTTPHDFAGSTRSFASDARAFAQLGFVVVMLDSRGTPMRSKAFQDTYYNRFGEFGLEDHVAAIKEIGAARPWMDLDRVGLYGHSFGGYAAMKGILGFPDFFKASAASAGPYDLFGMYSLEAFFEPPVYKNGTSKPSAPDDRPTNWGSYDLTKDAAKLKGKLLLAYGDLDENAWPAVTARMVDALIAANKSFELIYMPNRPHAFSLEPYFVRRRWDFFVRELAGKQPPSDYLLKTTRASAL